MSRAVTVAVDDLLERQKVGKFLLRTLVIGTIVQMLDGYDLIAIGSVGPDLAHLLHIERAQMGPIFGASFIGATIGAFIFGTLGDRYGRKSMTIACTLIFGVFTLATVWATTFPAFIALRFLTGLGIGGVIPTTVALMSEYAPLRVRGIVVTTMACGLSLGAAGTGIVSAQLVPQFGWQAIFYVGGILPIIVVPLLLLWLPESVRYLVLKKKPGARIAAILRQVDANLRFDATSNFTVREAVLTGFPVRRLFDKGWGAATILLWITIFMNLLCITFFSQWMPTLYNLYGLEMGSAVTAAAMFQVGGVLGAVGLGRLIDKFGFFNVLGTSYFGGALFAVLLVSFGPARPVMITLSFMAGLCIAGAQNAANAMSGAFYPTMVRSTGSGWGLGIGRIGGIGGPFVGGALLGAHWSVPAIFGIAAVPLLCAGAAVLLLGRQARRSPEIQAARQLAGSAAGAH
jgi:MFS transporter, AAHS family, 4-hydroxybenzoate transporter